MDLHLSPASLLVCVLVVASPTSRVVCVCLLVFPNGSLSCSFYSCGIRIKDGAMW